ncbi:MAG TPA: transcription termination factor Rho [bacterium]|nr:transcription termination factor Rho [bacterium]
MRTAPDIRKWAPGRPGSIPEKKKERIPITELTHDDRVCGVLQVLERSGGFLRDPAYSFQPGRGDVFVPPPVIRETGLVEGAMVCGTAVQTDRGNQLSTVESVCGLPPDQFRSRSRFDKLIVVNPDERIRLGGGGNPTMRIVDLIAPIGKGTRGLIVAAPKTGKTRILEEMAAAIRHFEPEARIIVLLIDERPEEVTHFRRRVDAEVLASSSDQAVHLHVNLAELTLAHVRTELECGRDVVVLVDSLTRMSRAFNQHSPGAGRTLSGGLDARALEIPRRFFGLARNVENGGSVTVIATVLIDTGSRMDDYIFEEFKGTGNSEIVLDRSLADARVFPAINLKASGTRREELLLSDDEMRWSALLRRGLAKADPVEAMRGLVRLVETSADNQDLIRKTAPGA